MDYQNINEKNNKDHIIKLILKENEILKTTIKEKFPNEFTLNSLLNLLDIQRNKIDNLEQGNFKFNKRLRKFTYE